MIVRPTLSDQKAILETMSEVLAVRPFEAFSPVAGAVASPSVRVAYLNHIGNAIGGAERTLAVALKHRASDIESHVLLFEDGDFADLIRSLGVDVRVVPVPDELVNTKREKISLKSAFAVPAAAFRVARILRELRIDVLYTNSMKAHIVGSLASKIAGVPCIMHFHDHMQGKGLKILRAAATLGSSHRIACSAGVRDGIGLDKTSVVFSAVDEPDFKASPSREAARAQLGIDPELPTVAIVGRINRWKGHDRFLRIAARVAKDRKVQFLVVGSPMFRDDDFVPELHRLTRELGIENDVKFIPWLDDVAVVYAATDIVANCSDREPLGRTPAEAAAAGRPSVVFDDSGAAEWMRNSQQGRVVAAGDEAAFAEALIDLIDDGSASRDRATSLRMMAMPFDASVVSLKVAKIIRDTAAGRRVA